MRLMRLLKHLSAPGWWARRAFRADDLTAIGAAVKAAESKQRGEIRVAIEGALPLRSLRDDQSCRARAAELFSSLGMADTLEANGILVYVQLIDRQVEIMADRGIATLIPQDEWAGICRQMELAFAAGKHRDGMIAAIESIGTMLAAHFPATADNLNELDNAPVIL